MVCPEDKAAGGGTNTVLVVEPLDATSLRNQTDSGEPKSLDELRAIEVAADAAARAMMAKEKFTAEEIEYAAKFVNRGPDSVDGSMPELLEQEDIKVWRKAQRAYVSKRDAAGRK